MLKTRVLVAVVALPILLAVILLGGWAFSLLVLAVLVIGGIEYIRLFRQGSYCPPQWITLALVGLAWGATWFEKSTWRDPGLNALLIAGLFYVVWSRERGNMQSVTDLAIAFFGGIYIGWLGSTLLAVRMLDDGAFLTITLYGMVIVADSAAFFVGRRWGKRRLSPSVSPKKSWEGYIGGIIGGMLFGALIGALPGTDALPAGHGAIIGLLLGIWGTVGDLGKSAIKRQVGAKDSSHLIPGHGGMLDRIDSVLVSAAIGYYYLLWFVQ